MRHRLTGRSLGECAVVAKAAVAVGVAVAGERKNLLVSPAC